MTAPDSLPLFTATEDARLAALQACHALDTAPGPDLEGLVRLAARLFQVPCAFIGLVDEERLFIKAAVGWQANELPRQDSLCAYLVEHRCRDPLVVTDAAQDARFAQDPLVAGEPLLRFLAAAALITPEGHFLGAFCIGDTAAHTGFPADETGMLADLAALAMMHMARGGRAIPDCYGDPVPEQSAVLHGLRERPGSGEVRHLTQLQQREQRLFRLAGLDPLTELADRDAFADALTSHSAAGTGFSLVLLDIDDFRQVSAALDQHALDTVLKTLAHRLRVLFQEGLIVSRLGGDEFAVLLGETSPDALRRVCRLALQAIADPIDVDGRVLSVRASIGIATSPVHGSGQVLLAHADLALYEAKQKGTQVYRFYSEALGEAVIWRKKTENELRHAHTGKQFEIRYQPQLDLATRQVVGAEALLRWHHPVRGLVQPGDFLSVLETSPSMARVGAWILSSACACAARWRSIGMPDFRVAVNLFPAQVHSGHLHALIMDALAASGLPPDALELEITENTLLKPDAALVDALGSLREAGVHIAFDDYGTGYASLSLLKRLPVTRLKIDRSFVLNLPQDAENAAVVQAILFLGRQFGLSVVAEGIETSAQETFLREHGCHEGQGYLYSEALPEAEFFTRYVLPAANRHSPPA